MSKKLFIIIGFLSALLAVIIAVTAFYKLAITPIIIAFISGLIVLLLSKKQKIKTKTIQYIFLLVIIALGLTIYKGVIKPSELDDTEQLEQQHKESFEDSEKTLQDIEIEEDN